MARFAAIPMALTALMVVGTLHAESWMLRRDALAEGALWSLWSGHFAHASAFHLIQNMLAFAVLTAWLTLMHQQRLMLGLCVLTSPLISAGMMLAGYDGYLGFSGVLHALAALAILQLPGPWRAGACVLMGVKLACEILPGTTAVPLNPAVATEAHLLGFALGMFLGTLQRATHQQRIFGYLGSE